MIITGWRFNGETAASHYATSGLVVVVETCAALLHHTNGFAALKAYTNSVPATDIWTFSVTEVILGCFPHLSCKNSGRSMQCKQCSPSHRLQLGRLLIQKFDCGLKRRRKTWDFMGICPTLAIFYNFNWAVQ